LIDTCIDGEWAGLDHWQPTTREREILQLIAEGKSNKANHLNLSLHTVETHRTHILQKLNLHSIPDLILYAVRKGVVA